MRWPGKKIYGYAAWVAVAGVLPLFVDRLFVHPMLNEALGRDKFGQFIWVLGVIGLFGSCTTVGFSTLLMRDYVNYGILERNKLVRTSISLGAPLTAIIVSLGLVAAIYIPGTVITSGDVSLFVPLGCVAMMRTVSELLVTDLRIGRQFKSIFKLRLAEAGILCLNFFVIPYESYWLIGSVYLISASCACFFVGRANKGLINAPWFDRSSAGWLLGGWYAGATINIFSAGTVYISRIVTGVYVDSGEVAVLYAGLAIANIFVLPISVLSGLVLSLLGGEKNFVFSGKSSFLYLVMAVLTGGLSGLAAAFGGPLLLRYLYPDFSHETMRFYPLLAAAAGFQCLVLCLKPVIVKYAPLSRTTILAGFTFALMVCALLLTVPGQGAHGAARASLIATGTSASIWAAYFLWLTRQKLSAMGRRRN